LGGKVLIVLALLVAGCGRGAGGEERGAAALAVGELLGGADTLHARAVAVPRLEFPRDHGPHPEFRTEWWYFTGNVTADDGREFGYQLTFFRSALTDSASFAAATAGFADGNGGAGVAAADVGAGDAAAGVSRWRARHAWMAHFAVSDITGRSFHHGERFARDAVGLAGAQAEPFRVWLGPWQAAAPAGSGLEGAGTGVGADGAFSARLVAAEGDVAIDLVLTQGKRMVLQGEAGLSRKGPEPGNASYYYSYTRMPTAGTVRVGDRSYRVTGTSWLDREWSTSALSPELEGWDWMALQFDDGTELMLYRLRRADGSAGEFSAGTFVDVDGGTTRLRVDDFLMTPTATWRSPLDGTAYPTSWRVTVPALALALEVNAAFEAQEMDLAVRYWEGAVRITGSRGGRAVAGRGYLEMTGY
jgi:predicted secreted hydrolase